MDGEAIKELAQRLRGPQAIDGFILAPNGWDAHDPAALVKPAPSAKAFTVSTLSAVRDYLVANRDALPIETLTVHVEGPNRVVVGGPLRARSRDREYYVTAQAQDLTDGFLGKFMELEDFNIGLQVRFCDVEDRAKLLSLLSNVKSEMVKTALDDGVTQVLEARAGVALVREVAVPNPVRLAPYRTFRDLPQPSSPYVLRVQNGRSGGLPQVGLFEADGGAWKLTTTEQIRLWLRAALPATVAVLA